ncbi:MAG: TonB-dependent receptor, partial [Bacteroidales bacterium]|nr:TonB-dependent receptor [Bacteroidales bacterium]
MQKRRFTTFLITMMLPFLAMAQSTVKGFIYYKDNGEPVPFANIILQDTKFGASTDINGFFLINKIPKGEYTLVVKYVGYEDYSEKLSIASPGQTVQLRIDMKPSVKTLQTVKVSGRRQERKDDTKVSVEKISPMEIQQMPSIGGQSDIAQYLQVLPGINFTGDQGGQLYIRGGSMIQNKTLLDGMVVYNPFHSIGLFSVFETDVILNADVYTGGFGAEYGGRISSVLDITTRDGNSKRHTGKISANTMGAGLLLEGPLKKERPGSGSSLTYLVTAKNSYLSQSSKLLYPYIQGGLPYDFLDVYGKMTLKSESGSKISAFGFGYNDWVRKYQSIADYKWNNYGAGANFVIVPGSDALVEGTLAYSKYRIEFSDVANTGFDPRTSEIGGLSGVLDIVNFF